jgi:peptidoglycan hydrolase-like protein with peptidoglycan-binding domain
MHVTHGGPCRSTNKRNARWWALAISALALAYPTSAVAAQATPTHPRPVTARFQAEPTGQERGAPGDAQRRLMLLSLGSGYTTPGGSPLVRAVQRDLGRAGYSPDGVDGLYGPRTRRAVLAFQASHGLRVDGVVGAQTWVAWRVQATSFAPGAGGQPGGSGAVRSLQRGLARAGDAPGPIDGDYGVLTENAVDRFQRAHGLTVDGIAARSTLATLFAASASTQRTGVHRTSPRSRPARSARAARPRNRPVSAAPAAPAVPMSATSGRKHSSGTEPWLIVLLGLWLVVPLALAARYKPWRRAAHPGRAAAPSPRPAPAAAAMPVGGPRGDEAASRRHDGRTAHDDNGRPVPTNRYGNGRPATANGHRSGNGNGRPAATPVRAARDGGGSVEAERVFNLGVVLEKQGSLIEAQSAYGRADERGHARAASNLGRLLEEQGVLGEAEAAYRRADVRGDPDGTFNLGVLLEERHELDEAAAAYRRALDRGHDGAASNLGVLLEEQGELADAEAAYRCADQRGDATAAFNLGVLLEEEGALIAAREAYGRAEQRGDPEVADLARDALRDLGTGQQRADGNAAPAAHHD